MARELVEERLAASVNRIPCASVYRWNDEVRRDDEEVLLVKTTDERYDDVVEAITDRHPHDVPAIERFDESDATPPFAEWRRDCVAE